MFTVIRRGLNRVKSALYEELLLCDRVGVSLTLPGCQVFTNLFLDYSSKIESYDLDIRSRIDATNFGSKSS